MMRADNLSSSGVELTEEDNHVTDALKGNRYPLASSSSTPLPAGERKGEQETEQLSCYLTLVGCLRKSDVS